MKAFLLFVAGAMIAVAAGAAFPPPWSPCLTIAVIVLAIAFALIGAGIWDSLTVGIARTRRRARILPLKIGVLNQLGWDPNDPQTIAWATLSPEKWVEEIRRRASDEGLKATVSLVHRDDKLWSYSAIVNPYGGVYPEADVRVYRTLGNIMEYVNDGGIFVNVADVATYWAYDFKIRRRVDATPAVAYDEGRPVRPFFKTPLIESLGLWIRSITAAGTSATRVFDFDVEFQHLGEPSTRLRLDRLAVCEPNVRSVLVPIDLGGFKFTPLFFARYGRGQCLLSLLFMGPDHVENNSLPRILSKALVHELRARRT